MADHFGSLTPEIACEALRRAGLSASPAEVRVSAREERWAVSLPGERIARTISLRPLAASRASGLMRLRFRKEGERCSSLAMKTV